MYLKKIGIVLLLVFFIFLLIVVGRTFIHSFPEHNNHSFVGSFQPDLSENSIKRFAGGLRIPTVSNIVYEETDFEPFRQFKIYLLESYPRIYETMKFTTINEFGLVFHWKGKKSTAKPILFLSHYDVVPVTNYEPTMTDDSELVFRLDEDTYGPVDTIQTHWDYPAFSGAVANGRIYGRGSLDMKGMLFSIMEAADILISQGFQPEQDIWFAFGQDEEVSGLNGAYKIAEYFKESGLVFDAVYDEGGIIAAPGAALSSVNKPIALVGFGEKGFLTVRITVSGVGGHSSMPPAKSSLVLAAEIIEKLNENQLPTRLIPPIESFLNEIGGYMNFTSQMAISNQWLLKPVLLKSLTKSPASNALVRTTTAISMAKGSDAPNVLAGQAQITVNFRILQGESVNDIINHVKEICKDYETQIEVLSSREPSGISSENSRGFQVIKEAVKLIHPDALISAYITIGGTDAYKYQIVSDNIYRFMPVYLNQHEQRIIHNDNEYISIDNYAKMIAYFKYIMENY